MDTLNVFLSYSLTKTYDKRLTETAVGIAKERVEAKQLQGWAIINAMKTSVGWIRSKVEESLRNSDLVIAEATTWSPNVMFELGFARAHNYPIVILLNRSVPQDENVAAYYRFLGIDHSALPADLGDIEFIPYSGDISYIGGRGELEQRIDTALNSVRKALPPGLRLLRRSEWGLQKKINHLGESCSRSDDPPMLRLLGGWFETVVKELGDAGSNGFLVDPKYYPACFRRFRDDERYSAFAIADLSDQTESDSILNNPKMTISERIILISSSQFFDDKKLTKIFRLVRLHLEGADLAKYRLLVARADDKELPSDHPFPKTPSRDLLLIGPDLVGGYEKRHRQYFGEGSSSDVERDADGQPYLYVTASRDLFKTADRYYRAVRKRSFQFDPAWKGPGALKFAWLSFEEQIGWWDDSWKFQVRNSGYYDFYDLHIRAWIPCYEDFLKTTAARVRDTIMRLPKESGTNTRGVMLLEIGSGTGNLTMKVLDSLSPLEGVKEVIGQILALDMAESMVRRTYEMIERTSETPEWHGLKHKFKAVNGLAFSALGQEVWTLAPFSVIYGSLVLSHLLQAEITKRLDEVLGTARKLLVPGGTLVLADALVPNPGDRESLKEWWRVDMVNHGLRPETAKRFLDHNREMLETVTHDELSEACARHGFDVRIEEIPGFSESPFRTITIMRTA